MIQTIARSTSAGVIDQRALRRCLGLSSSFLISDTTMNTTSGSSSGLTTWNTGFNRLVDLLVVLHARDELELRTVDEASKACSECWTVAGAWTMDEARNCVKVRQTNLTLHTHLTAGKAVARKLQGLLDANQRTYKNQAVYAP